MVGNFYLPAASSQTSGWTPPVDWPDISNVATNQVKLVVADTNLTYAFSLTTSAGTFTIDWGDGNVSIECVSGSTVQHTYIRGAGTACSRGYTTFVVSITPDSGNVTRFQIKRNNKLTVKQNYDILYANISKLPYLTTYDNMFYDTTSSAARCPKLEGVIMPTSWGTATSTLYMFGQCCSLRGVTLPTSWGSVSAATHMFNGCSSITSISLPSSWGSITSVGYMFYSCTALGDIILPSSWGSITSITYMFYNCTALSRLILPSSWGSITNTSSFAQECQSLQLVSMPTSFGNITSATGMFNNCISMQYDAGMQYLGSTTQQSTLDVFTSTQNIEGTISFNSLLARFRFVGTSGNNNLITGIRFTNSGSTFTGTSPQIDIAYNNLSASAIAAIFNDLPTLSGKTIRITGCTGAADTSSDSIATGKGWTINRST